MMMVFIVYQNLRLLEEFFFFWHSELVFLVYILLSYE